MNILWIVTTQWRAQSGGYSGSVDVTTPGLDRLARRSIDFTQAVTPHPFGPFARAALLTGIPSPQNGVVDYFDPLPVGLGTIADELEGLGYHTAFFGKWHLAPKDKTAPLVGDAHAQTVVPEDRRGGFSFWEGFEGGFQLNNPWLHGTRLPGPTQFPGYQSDVLCERAGDWLSTAPDQPWFCVVSLEPPHPPYEQSPSAGMYDAERLGLPGNVLCGDTALRARRELAGYYGHISATDAAIDRLLSRIDLETTIVVFTSVHGDMHGAHGLFRKGWPYEESIRVPLLVHFPGANGLKSQAAVSLVDLPRLTLQWAQGAGLAFLDVLADEFARISMPSVVRLPDQCDRVWSGVRSPRRKLILNRDGSPWLFFDLENDPLEVTNLVGDAHHAREIMALKTLYFR